MNDTREEFEKWAVENFQAGKTNGLARKESGEYLWSGTALAWDVWQAALNTRAPSPANTEAVKAAFRGVTEATTYLPIPERSALECAELNAKEWFKHGYQTALSALPQVRQMTVEEVAKIMLCGCEHFLEGNTVYNKDMHRAASALAKLGAIKITEEV